MTDHNLKMVLKAAQEAGFEVHPRKQQARVGWDALTGVDSTPKLERFYAIAYQQGMERAAEICESRQTPGTGSVAILNGAADAIRAEAHAKNQPESTHDTGNV